MQTHVQESNRPEQVKPADSPRYRVLTRCPALPIETRRGIDKYGTVAHARPSPLPSSKISKKETDSSHDAEEGHCPETSIHVEGSGPLKQCSRARWQWTFSSEGPQRTRPHLNTVYENPAVGSLPSRRAVAPISRSLTAFSSAWSHTRTWSFGPAETTISQLRCSSRRCGEGMCLFCCSSCLIETM